LALPRDLTEPSRFHRIWAKYDQLQRRERADEAPVLRLSYRGSGHSEQTIDAAAKAIARFEAYTRYKDFNTFHIEQAKGLQARSCGPAAHRSGEPLSKATLYATLTALKQFFVWLAEQPGYKSRISYSDAEYFNLSAKDMRIAKATRPARVPTLEQIRHVIRTMPATSDIERRDRALIAFTTLAGARDGAVSSFKLRHIDIAEGKIDQDAREGRTKFSKTFATSFFPVGDEIRGVVVDWVSYLRRESCSRRRGLRWGPTFASQRQGWIASTGAAPVRSGRYSRKRLLRLDCRISIRTVSGKRWRF
jgi:hypothetical protein